MKKGLLLLGSIALFFVSLFFVIGVLVFIGSSDFEGVIILGIPLLLFGTLFYKTLKKYLIIINFKFSDFLLKWKNSKFLRVMDFVLSCIFYIFVLTAMESHSSSFIIFLILTLFFGLIYIIKPLLKNNVDFSMYKNKWKNIVVHIILFVVITLLSVYYLDSPMSFGKDSFGLSMVEIYDSGLERIVFLIIYYLFKFIFRQGLICVMAVYIYASLVLYIDNCFKNSSSNEKKVIIFNVYALCLFIIVFIIFVRYGDVIKNLKFILLNIVTFIMLIINIINKYKEMLNSQVQKTIH